MILSIVLTLLSTFVICVAYQTRASTTSTSHTNTSTAWKLSTSLHLHFAFLDYVSAFSAGTSILLFPEWVAAHLFFPELETNAIVVFALQLFGFMLVVFASHFTYHIHCSLHTLVKMRAILVLLFVGDLLHLFVYHRGVHIFQGGVMNRGVLPNVVISTYAGLSRLWYLRQPNYGLVQ